jgi:hypothetical protein
VVSVKFSLSSLLSATFLVASTLLAGCGGGGAQDPYATVTYPSLIVNPTTLNIYAGTPAVVTINSGVAPFQVFTSDAVVLPVTQVVPGAAITLTASAVAAEATVTLTVRDAVGHTVPVSVVVKPSPLIGSLNIVPTTNTTCSGVASASPDKAAVCSGESGLASVSLKSNATTVLANRQVRFDVVQGAYNFVVDQAGAILNKTITVVTDQNGKADAVIRTDAAVGSQVGLIRATDVTSGNRVDSAFSIVQSINGSATLTVLPGSGYTAKGYYKLECPGTSGDFIIFGGTAPYTVRSALPNAVSLSVNGVVGDPIVVAKGGDTFRASTSYSSNCADYAAEISIADASGRVVKVTYAVQAGTVEHPALPDLALAPSAVTLAGACGNRQVSFTVAGGSGSGSFSTSVGAGVMSGSVLTTPATFASGQSITVIYVDAVTSKLLTANVSCQ